MKRALITGITGQDGAYLANFLLKKGYKIYGTFRRTSTPNFWRLHYLDIFDNVELIPCNLTDSSSFSEVLETSNPDEIYHLASQSFVDVSFDQPLYTGNTISFIVTLLEEIKKYNKKIRLYNASSSEIFGFDKNPVKKENTLFTPTSPYGAAKLYAYCMCNIYKKTYGMSICNGILFNHESPIRGIEFVTRKISNGVAKISLGLSKSLELGDLSSKRDWGYSPEYVEGMWMMVKHKQPDNYILATNESHSVQEFVEEACKVAGIPTSKIKSSKRNYRPNDILDLKGDYSKAKKILGWKPKTKFKKLVKILVEEDINRWEKWLKGERFPWDIDEVEIKSSIYKK